MDIPDSPLFAYHKQHARQPRQPIAPLKFDPVGSPAWRNITTAKQQQEMKNRLIAKLQIFPFENETELSFAKGLRRFSGWAHDSIVTEAPGCVTPTIPSVEPEVPPPPAAPPAEIAAVLTAEPSYEDIYNKKIEMNQKYAIYFRNPLKPKRRPTPESNS